MFNALRRRKYRFKVEEISSSAIRGWVYNRKNPHQPQTLRLSINGSLFKEFDTEILRPELNAKHAIQGRHGFRQQLPLGYFDGRRRRIELSVLDMGKAVLLESSALQEHQDRIAWKVESCDAKGLRGWVFDREDPSRPLRCRMYLDARLVDEFETHIERTDLNAKQDIQGLHGFRRLFPLAYLDGKPRTLCLTLVQDQEILLDELTLQDSVDGVKFKLEQPGPFQVKGWAFDQTDTDASLTLKLYCNDQKVLSTATKEHRPDVNRKHEISGKHGFDIRIPMSALQDEHNQITVNLVHNKQEVCLGKTISTMNMARLKEDFAALEDANKGLHQQLRQEQESRKEDKFRFDQDMDELRQKLHLSQQQVQHVQNSHQQLEQENSDLRNDLEDRKNKVRELLKRQQELEQMLQESEKNFGQIENMIQEIIEEN